MNLYIENVNLKKGRIDGISLRSKNKSEEFPLEPKKTNRHIRTNARNLLTEFRLNEFKTTILCINILL